VPKKREERPGLIDQLKEQIRGSGRSLNQIAEGSGISVSQLSRFMRGERGLTLHAAEKVCRTLHLHLEPDEPPDEESKPKRGRPRKPGGEG
jgi:transcriptional regulator with XRE-family HTH domain